MALTPTSVLVASKAAFGFVRGEIVSDVAKIEEILATDAKHSFVRATHMLEAAEAAVKTEAEVVADAVAAAVHDVEAKLHPSA